MFTFNQLKQIDIILCLLFYINCDNASRYPSSIYTKSDHIMSFYYGNFQENHNNDFIKKITFVGVSDFSGKKSELLCIDFIPPYLTILFNL